MGGVTLIKKEVRTYSQGNKTIQRINILKSDNLDGEVYILTPKEYEDLKKENESNKQFIQTLSNNHDIFEKQNIKLTEQVKTQKHYDKLFKDLEKTQSRTIRELDKSHTKQLLLLDKRHNAQINENYKDFHKQLQKYIDVYKLQNKALKDILDLGYIDLIRNKYKKIARDNIKELDTSREYIEYTIKEKKY